ncbi:MAG: glutaminyl-peptide cyclotransferase, partial [Candidatus Dadabacteria bacterium]
MKRLTGILAALTILALLSCNNSSDNEPENTPVTPALSYTLGGSLPHDTSSFTEGLEFYNNNLLESTGNYGKSKLLEMDPTSGKVLKQVVLDPKYFGEGISVLRDTIYQMTYKEHVVFLYSAKDFTKIKEQPLNTEGWGMTNDGKNLIVSDGSSNLFFYEPGTFRLLKTQAVTENGVPAVNVNELEYINGYVYANQWQYNYILKIDPNTGAVIAKMDLTDLVNRV